jgi:hypothetical protein
VLARRARRTLARLLDHRDAWKAASGLLPSSLGELLAQVVAHLPDTPPRTTLATVFCTATFDSSPK